MIVVEEKLRDLFDMIPEIEVNPTYSTKPFYSWGRKEALNEYIKVSKSNNYPLIWLIPSVDEVNFRANTVTRKLSLVIATLETRDELSNPQRYQGSYLHVLNPLTDYIMQALQNSTITRIISSEISILKEPNYTDADNSGTIDKWDAVRIDCEVEFNNFCLKDIRWR